jgi:hypothetical protein
MEARYRNVGRMPKAVLIACLCAIALALAPAALAGGSPPANPSIAQYIEQVPTSGGNAVPSGHAHTKLPAHVAEQLPSGKTGAALRTIATRASYGAPQKKLHVSKHAAVVARRAVIEPKKDVSGDTLAAAASAVGADRNLVVWLGVVLLFTAGAGVGAAVARARR